jgi:hypothetical protein
MSQSSSPAFLLITGARGQFIDYGAAYRVMPFRLCYRCVDLLAGAADSNSKTELTITAEIQAYA